MNSNLANDFMSKPGRWNGPNTSAPRRPMTPEELETYKVTGMVASAREPEAQAIARNCGIRELAPVIQRLISAERTIAELAAKVTALETSLLEVKYPQGRR